MNGETKLPRSHDVQGRAIILGHPSYVWRFGQDRRLELIRRYAPLDAKRILDVGCGLGVYVRKLRAFSSEVYGVDIDSDKVAQTQQELEHMRGHDYQNMASETLTQDVDGMTFTITTNVKNDIPVLGVTTITVTVSWTGNFGPKSYAIQSYYTDITA